MVVLTDLTPTVLGWRGSAAAGRAARRAGHRAPAAARLRPAVRGLAGQDTAAQVWAGTHTVFFWAYAVVDLAVFAGVGVVFWGARPGRRRRRARWWRAAGTIAGAVPAGSFLANVVPWWLLGHPAVWQYALIAAVDRADQRDRAGRAVAAGPVRAAGGGRGGDGADRRAGRDDRFPAAAGRTVRPVGAGSRPVLRNRRGRDRPVRRLRHHRRGLGGPHAAPGRRPEPGARGRVRGRVLRGDRLRLAAVRREGRRHDRPRPLLPAAADGDGRDQDHGTAASRWCWAAGWPCSPSSRSSITSSRPPGHPTSARSPGTCSTATPEDC